jgi:hypothetical protein
MLVIVGTRDSNTGVECAASVVSGDGLRRHSRPISRSARAVSNRRRVSELELPLHGRLRRSRLLLGRNRHVARRTEM